MIRSGGGGGEGIPSLPGAFPEAKLLMALLRLCGRFGVDFFHERRALDGMEGCSRHSILSGVEVGIVLHPPLHLLPLSVMTSPVVDFREAVLLCTGCLDATIHPSDVPCNCCFLDCFTEL